MVTTTCAGVWLRLGRKHHGTKPNSKTKLKRASGMRSISRLRRQFRKGAALRTISLSHKASAPPASNHEPWIITSARRGAVDTVSSLFDFDDNDQTTVDKALALVDSVPNRSLVLDMDLPASSTSVQLADTLRVPLTPFLQSNAGGTLSASATTTAVNRISQFIEWVHRHLCHGEGPSVSIAESARQLFDWYIDTIGKYPHVLEEYVDYQLNIIQRGPSTVLNHLDALMQCFNFLVYDGRLSDNLDPVVATAVFQTRFPFFNLRCRRTLKKQLKKYK